MEKAAAGHGEIATFMIIDYSEDEQRIIISSYDGSVKMLDTGMELIKELEEKGMQEPVKGIAWDSTDKVLYCNEFGTHFMRVFDFNKNYRCRKVDVGRMIAKVMFFNRFLITSG